MLMLLNARTIILIFSEKFITRIFFVYRISLYFSRLFSENELKVSIFTLLHTGLWSSFDIIWARAFLVKVIARIFSAGTERNWVRNSILFVRTVVFPEPAPAMQRIFSEGQIIAFFC